MTDGIKGRIAIMTGSVSRRWGEALFAAGVADEVKALGRPY